MNVLIEAVGSLSSGYIIKAIKECGFRVIGSDISDFNHGFVLCDDFVVFPKASDINLWDKIENILVEKKIDVVFPSLDETLIGWSRMSDRFKKYGVNIILSPLRTLEITLDKWETYKFFKGIGVNVPETSKENKYVLIKPRFGRGSKGIFLNEEGKDIPMDGYISQERIEGKEYSVDVLYDKDGNPIYIVPRERIDVRDGKSTKGIVVREEKINEIIIYISKKLKFIGPVNFQFIKKNNGEFVLIEVNPRLAGGMALSFAATENWIKLIIENVLYGRKIIPKEIKYGLKMFRYYDECFI